MCSFDLIPNLDTFTTYFLFNYLCALQKDVRFYTQGQWICGNYLEISYNIQVYLKGRSWGLFIFCCWLWQHICRIHVSQWSFWSNMKLGRCLPEPQPPGRPLLSWQGSPDWEIWGTHLIPAEGRIMSWWCTVRPKLYHRHHSEWVAWGFAFIRCENQKPGGELEAKAVSPAGETLKFTSIAGKELCSPTKYKQASWYRPL